MAHRRRSRVQRRAAPGHGRGQAVAGRPEASAGPRAADRHEGQRQYRAGRVRRGPRQEERRRHRRGQGGHQRQRNRDEGRRGGHRRHHLLHQHLQSGGDAGRRPAGAQSRGPRPEAGAVGQDLARPGLAGGHRLPEEGRCPEGSGIDGLLRGRLRLHHLHRQLRPAAGRRVQGHRRRRPDRGLGAVGQPQLRRPRARRSEDELPGLAAAGGGLRPGRHRQHRPQPRTAGQGCRRQ